LQRVICNAVDAWNLIIFHLYRQRSLDMIDPYRYIIFVICLTALNNSFVNIDVAFYVTRDTNLCIGLYAVYRPTYIVFYV